MFRICGDTAVSPQMLFSRKRDINILSVIDKTAVIAYHSDKGVCCT